MKKRWRLVVRDGREADILLHRLGLRVSKFRAGEYVGYYAQNAKPQLLAHIKLLKAAGLHGLAKQVDDRPPTQGAAPKRSAAERTAAYDRYLVHHYKRLDPVPIEPSAIPSASAQIAVPRANEPHRVVAPNPLIDGRLVPLSEDYQWVIVGDNGKIKEGYVNLPNLAAANRLLDLLAEHGVQAIVGPRFRGL